MKTKVYVLSEKDFEEFEFFDRTRDILAACLWGRASSRRTFDDGNYKFFLPKNPPEDLLEVDADCQYLYDKPCPYIYSLDPDANKIKETAAPDMEILTDLNEISRLKSKELRSITNVYERLVKGKFNSVQGKFAKLLGKQLDTLMNRWKTRDTITDHDARFLSYFVDHCVIETITMHIDANGLLKQQKLALDNC